MELPSDFDSCKQYIKQLVNTSKTTLTVHDIYQQLINVGIDNVLAYQAIDRLIAEGNLRGSLYGFTIEPDGFVSTLVNNKRMTLPPLGEVLTSTLIQDGQHEPFAMEWARHFLYRGDIAVDVGANIGVWALHLQELVGKEGLVIALEPDPSNFELLKKNVVANCCPSTVISQLAVGEEAGMLRLWRDPKNCNNHSALKEVDWNGYTDVPVITLDRYLSVEDKVHLLKIDVEGSECKVLKGAKSLISKQERLVLFIEYWPAGLRKLGNSGEEFEVLLRDLGFNYIYAIDEGERRLIDCTNRLNELIPFDSDNRNAANLICIKR